jgi:hypothetical protein
MSSDIEEDDLDNPQEVLHVDQTCRDKAIQTTRVTPPTIQSRAGTVIACTSLPNPRYTAVAMGPPLLKRQKSTINISQESDIVQVLLLPKADGNHNVLPTKAQRW